MLSSVRERRAGWGFLGFSKSFFRNSNSKFQDGRRRSTARYCYNGPSWYGQRPYPGVYGGLKGGARLHRWCEPRFSPHTRSGTNENGVFSLFVDGISSYTSTSTLRLIFKGYGVVMDAFISRKSRPNRKDRFGFVRFRYKEEAERAIMELNGQRLDGGILLISMAKYKRGGVPFKYGSSFNFASSKDISAGSMDRPTGKKVMVLGNNVVPTPSSSEKSALSHSEKGIISVGDFENKMQDANGAGSTASKEVQVNESSLIQTAQDARREGESINGENKTKNCPVVVKEVPPVKSGALLHTKKPKDKRKLLNSREIAEYLGFFTSGPSPAVTS